MWSQHHHHHSRRNSLTSNDRQQSGGGGSGGDRLLGQQTNQTVDCSVTSPHFCKVLNPGFSNWKY